MWNPLIMYGHLSFSYYHISKCWQLKTTIHKVLKVPQTNEKTTMLLNLFYWYVYGNCCFQKSILNETSPAQFYVLLLDFVKTFGTYYTQLIYSESKRHIFRTKRDWLLEITNIVSILIIYSYRKV